jgi:hypothetical protein
VVHPRPPSWPRAAHRNSTAAVITRGTTSPSCCPTELARCTPRLEREQHRHADQIRARPTRRARVRAASHPVPSSRCTVASK